MRLKTLFVLLLLGVTIILAVMLPQQEQSKLIIENTPESNSYSLQQFSLTVMNAQGVKTYTIEGDELIQDEVSGESAMTNPSSIIYRNQNKEWKIDSRKGFINNDQSHITLSDQVHAERYGERQNQQNIKIDTMSLEIFLDENRIVSDEKVIITHDSGKLSGTGMVADLKSNTIKLNADVKGFYAP